MDRRRRPGRSRPVDVDEGLGLVGGDRVVDQRVDPAERVERGVDDLGGAGGVAQVDDAATPPPAPPRRTPRTSRRARLTPGRPSAPRHRVAAAPRRCPCRRPARHRSRSPPARRALGRASSRRSRSCAVEAAMQCSAGVRAAPGNSTNSMVVPSGSDRKNMRTPSTSNGFVAGSPTKLETARYAASTSGTDSEITCTPTEERPEPAESAPRPAANASNSMLTPPNRPPTARPSNGWPDSTWSKTTSMPSTSR